MIADQAPHFLDRDPVLVRHMRVLHVIVITELIVLVHVVEAEVEIMADTAEDRQNEEGNEPEVRSCVGVHQLILNLQAKLF